MKRLLCPAFLLLCTGLALPASAQTPRTEHTLTLEESASSPEASLSDLEWLVGRWTGDGLGAVVEESWLPPAGGAMAGVFRLVRDGALGFYEILLLREDEGSLVLELKHFEPDLTGWEEKEDVVRFPLVRVEEDTWWFDGLTVRRVAEDTMRVWVALEDGEGSVREALFEYRRER